MSREGKRLSGKQWNRGSSEDEIRKLDMKRNSKPYYRDRTLDDDWSGDDDDSLLDNFDDDLYFDDDLEEYLDEDVGDLIDVLRPGRLT